MSFDLERVKKLALRDLKRINRKPKEVSKAFLETVYESPINLKPRTIKKYTIKKEIIKKGEAMIVVSPRNWFMMGYQTTKIVLSKDRVVHKLLTERRLLMSDTPQEMFLQYEAYQKAKGKVLVGGLGLGMYANMIAKKKSVKEILVVEISEDVIKLSKPSNKKIRVVHDDIWKFLKTTKERFDFIYIDIHYSTGCMEYKKTVLPMRKIIEKRFPEVPNYFWAEEEMKAQYIEE